MFRNTFVILSLCLASFICQGQIKLPKLISDGMILQRDIPVNIWGWAAAGENIEVKFNLRSFTTVADRTGLWKVTLPATKAGGPYKMTFTASNKIELKDILFGDVYICGGQSNMELTMDRLVDKYPKDIAQANQAEIRQFLVPDAYDFNKPHADLTGGNWESATPQTVLNFSAAAYFFALEIQKNQHIPIGLINAAVGGSPTQSWLGEEMLKKFPEYYSELQKFKDQSLISSIESNSKQQSFAWNALLNKSDEGLNNNWKSNATNSQDWKEIQQPGYFPESVFNKLSGVVWLKKEINISSEFLIKPVKLLMGRIVDADSVFINGQFAGTTSYQYPPRRYLIKAGLLKKGLNIITIRLVSTSGKAGLVPDKPYQLIAGTDTVKLDGFWKYKIGTLIAPMPSQITIRWKPAGLFNTMIAPLQAFKIKGFLWYQGEANTSKPDEHRELMKSLIYDWRAGWAQGSLPFLFVQLPGYMEAKPLPSESNWAALRAAQQQLLTIANTGMAVAIDLGEWNDVHPLNKKDVGKRLALQAESLIYKQRITASGPYYKSVQRVGDKLVIDFSNTGTGLTSKENRPLKGFAVAGEDKNFVWATAVIKGNHVVVGDSAISKPVYIRYAWADNPDVANLYNKSGLPAAPFEAAVIH